MSLKIDRVQLQIVIDNDESRKKMAELEADTKRFKNELAKMQRQGLEGTDAYKAKLNELKQAQTAYDQLIEKIGIAGLSTRQLVQRQAELNAVLKNLNPNHAAYKQYEEQLKAINTRLAELRQGTKAVQESGSGGGLANFFGKAADGFNKYFGMFTTIAASMTGVILGFREMTKAAMEFEERVDNLSAITDLTGNDLNYLSSAAKSMSIATVDGGIKIKQSATDIVDAFTLMGSQRPELLKNKEALQAVTQDAIILSEAAKGKLEPNARALANTLNQFNLSATESRRVINVLAAGSKEGAAEISYLSEAVEKMGTTANLMGVSVEDSIALIEAIAPKFAKAEVAGNGLDKILMKMKASNIGFKDGVFSVNEAIEQLKVKFQQGETAEKMFGVEYAKVANVMVQSQGEFNRLKTAVTGTNVAIEQATINTNNKAAAMAQAKNRIQLYAITLGERLNPVLKGATGFLSGFLKMLVNLTGGLEDNVARLQKEQTQVNLLAAELMEANVSLTRRKQLYDEIIKISPQILEGIDKEAINYNSLRENLNKFNEEQVNRIVIARKQKELDEQNEKTADALNKKLETEVNVRQAIQKELASALKYNKDYYAAIKFINDNEKLSLMEKVAAMEEASNRIRKMNTNQQLGIMSSWWEADNRKLQEAQNVSNALLSERERLMKELGLNKASAPDQSAPDTTTNTETGTGGGGVDKDAQKRIEDFKRYILELRNLMEQDGRNRAKKELDLWYQTEKDKIKNAEVSEKLKGEARQALNNSFVTKLHAIDKKYDDERVAKIAEITAFIAENSQDIENIRKAELDRELAKIEDKYNEEVEVVRVAVAKNQLTETEAATMTSKLIELKNQEKNSAITKSDDEANAVRLKILEKYDKNNAAIIKARLNELEKQYKEDLKQFEGNEALKIKITEEYHKQRKQIEQAAVQDLIKDYSTGGQMEAVAQNEAEKLLLVQSYLDEGLINYEEFEIAKTNISKNASDERIRILESEINKATQVTSAWGDFFSQQKNYETQLVDNNLTKQLAKLKKEKANEIALSGNSQENIALINENYAIRENALKERTEEEKKNIAKRYADKEFAVKVAQIIAATAVGVMNAFQLGPIAGAVAAIAIGASGAVQIAMANEQRQMVKGLEHGGEIDVTRQQDGKPFRAAYRPGQRGYINRPTVLVGEYNKEEYVVSNEKLRIPSVRKFVNVLDSLSPDRLRYIDFSRTGLPMRMPGFADGGYVNGQTAQQQAQPAQQVIVYTDPVLLAAIEKLNNKLDQGIQASVNYFDIVEKQDRYEQLANDAYIAK